MASVKEVTALLSNDATPHEVAVDALVEFIQSRRRNGLSLYDTTVALMDVMQRSRSSFDSAFEKARRVCQLPRESDLNPGTLVPGLARAGGKQHVVTVLSHCPDEVPIERARELLLEWAFALELKSDSVGRGGKGTLGSYGLEEITAKFREITQQLSHADPSVLALILSVRMSFAYLDFNELIEQLRTLHLEDAEVLIRLWVKRRLPGDGRFAVGKALEQLESEIYPIRPGMKSVIRAVKRKFLLPPRAIFAIPLPAPNKQKCMSLLQAFQASGRPSPASPTSPTTPSTSMPFPFAATLSPTVEDGDDRDFSGYALEVLSEYLTREKREYMRNDKWIKTGRKTLSKDLHEIEDRIAFGFATPSSPVNVHRSKSASSSTLPTSVAGVFEAVRRFYNLESRVTAGEIRAPKFLAALPESEAYYPPTPQSVTSALYCHPRLPTGDAVSTLTELVDYEKDLRIHAAILKVSSRRDDTDFKMQLNDPTGLINRAWGDSERSKMGQVLDSIERRFPESEYTDSFRAVRSNLDQPLSATLMALNKPTGNSRSALGSSQRAVSGAFSESGASRAPAPKLAAQDAYAPDQPPVTSQVSRSSNSPDLGMRNLKIATPDTGADVGYGAEIKALDSPHSNAVATSTQNSYPGPTIRPTQESATPQFKRKPSIFNRFGNSSIARSSKSETRSSPHAANGSDKPSGSINWLNSSGTPPKDAAGAANSPTAWRQQFVASGMLRPAGQTPTRSNSTASTSTPSSPPSSTPNPVLKPDHDQYSYSCQKCHQPLKPDLSILELTSSQLKDMETQERFASIPAPQTSKKAYVEATRMMSFPSKDLEHTGILPSGLRGPAGSYVLLAPRQRHSDHATRVPPEAAGTRGVELTPATPSELFEKLSSTSAHDHPICTDCALLLQAELQETLDDLERERDAYAECSTVLEKGLTESEWSNMENEKARLQQQHDTLLKELEIAEEEHRQLRAEEAQLKEEERLLAEEERQWLGKQQGLELGNRTVHERIQSEQIQNMLASQTLSRLEATNVYNDVFQIGHVPLTTGSGSQTIGTINGLRLGGRPVVDWNEINAALGMVALCIDRIAFKVGCKFEKYKIVPLGSFSRVDELPPSKNQYELFASTDISPSRLLQNRRFNYALVGMLECLRQLVEFGKSRHRGWAGDKLEITKDKIGGHSIRLSASMGMSSIGIGGHSSSEGEESWTKALRAVLAVLKRILVLESETDRV